MTADVKHLKGRHEAMEIIEHCNVAYWMDGVCDITRDYHLRRKHEQFAELAAGLGYRIEKIEEEAEKPAEPVVITHRERYVSEFSPEIRDAFPLVGGKVENADA